MKRTCVLCIFLSLSLLGCHAQKKTNNTSNSKPVDTVKPAEVAKPVEVNPEIERLAKVISAMSDRCKAEMRNGSLEELLADLHKVLAVEASFPQDDLSLYYLIDKKHSVDESYVPTHLVKIQSNNFYVVNKKDIYLREDAEAALREMAGNAKADGGDGAKIQGYHRPAASGEQHPSSHARGGQGGAVFRLSGAERL